MWHYLQIHLQLNIHLYSQLDKGLAEELYQLYRVDFEMFGYSPQPYLDLAER